jgi:Mn2+/Fe2+ NRAMP family transporter
VLGLGSALRAVIGPTAVIAAGTMGAGAVASFLLAGAWFRYELLWVVPLMLPVFVVSVDTASRIGALNPSTGMFSLIRERLHPGLTWLLLAINVPVHVLIIMGQLSVMNDATISMAGQAVGTPVTLSPVAGAALYLVLACLVLWLVFSSGYERLQRVMTGLLIAMFLCFLAVALRGFSEWRAILGGLLPGLPADLPIPGTGGSRSASASVIAMLGSAIAPAALLGMPYLSSDGGNSASRLRESFRRAVLNLGFIFGAYAVFVVIAGGFALYPLENHAGLDDVARASAVLDGVFPGSLGPLGPLVFAGGVFIAALTTLVVAAQITVYFLLDTLGRDWAFAAGNRPYHVLVGVIVVGAALLAPHWSFPALLKVVLLMGINILVIPVAFVIVLLLANSGEVMGQWRAEWWRNGLLGLGLAVSLALAVQKFPYYWATLTH